MKKLVLQLFVGACAVHAAISAPARSIYTPYSFTTVLELHDGNGAIIAANDDWTSDQEAQILFSNLAPSDPRESAIFRNLSPGTYSATVLGRNGSSGVALVGVYVLP